MKFALAVREVGGTIEENIEGILSSIRHAAARGAELVLFSEASLTGLRLTDDPRRDLALGVSIGGAELTRIGGAAREARFHVALGFLERDGHTLYDSAVLFGPTGERLLIYRRLSPGWQARGADPGSYGRGAGFTYCDCALGRLGFLICGDLFEDALVAQAAHAHLNLLLFPFARSRSKSGFTQAAWQAEEWPHYAARLERMGAAALMVNHLDREEPRYFGGAWLVDARGKVVGHRPIGRKGLTIADLPAERRGPGVC